MPNRVLVAAWAVTLTVGFLAAYTDARLDGAPPLHRVPWGRVLRALTAALWAAGRSWGASLAADAAEGQAANRVLSFALSFGLLVRAAVWLAVVAVWLRWEGIERSLASFEVEHDFREAPMDAPPHIATGARLACLWVGLSLVVLVGPDARWGGPWWVTPAARTYLGAQVAVLVLEPTHSLRHWVTDNLFERYQ